MAKNKQAEDVNKSSAPAKITPIENAEEIALLARVKENPTSDMKELTGSVFLNFDEYREKKKANEFNFVFKGFGTFEDKQTGEVRETVRLIDEDGANFENSDAVMLSTMRKWKAANPDAEAVVIRVGYKGEKVKTQDGAGSYRKLTIHSY